MKYLQHKYLFLLSLILIFTACSEDYFDVNTPSGSVQPEQLRVSDLLAPTILSTFTGQYAAELRFGNYNQYFVSQGGGALGRDEISSFWSEIYRFILPNLKTIKEKAVEENAVHYDAIADILIAINIGIATDTWNNIPYTEATQGPENNFSSFDKQEDIYQAILTLLDNAIDKLNQTDNSAFTLGTDDLVYNGDIQKWKKLAYTIKARHQLRLVTKGVLPATAVLSTISNGFTSNADDFQLFFNERNLNPWFASEILARRTGNFHRDICKQLVSSMNGDYFPFNNPNLKIDPRLPLFATNRSDAEIANGTQVTAWKGYVSGGDGNAPDGTDANTRFVDGGYYTQNSSPIVLISFAEAKFIKAELEFLIAGGTTTSTGSSAAAYAAYIEGIRASMQKYDVNGTDYLADTSVDVGQGNLRLEHIMKEKYIHNFLNPETFSDYRRYDFSNAVFRGLEIRENNGDEDPEFRGQWFRRADYPATEENRNSTNVQQNKESPVTPVWWDQ